MTTRLSPEEQQVKAILSNLPNEYLTILEDAISFIYEEKVDTSSEAKALYYILDELTLERKGYNITYGSNSHSSHSHNENT